MSDAARAARGDGAEVELQVGLDAASLVVRRATVADAALIGRHRALMFRDMGELAESDIPALEDATARFLAEAIPAGEYHAWLAEPADAPGHVVAGAGVQLRRALPRPGLRGSAVTGGPEALALNVYVAPEWRRRGVAERLMRELLAWCHAQGIVRIALHASFAGRPLYERLGFVQTNEMRFQPDRVAPERPATAALELTASSDPTASQ